MMSEIRTSLKQKEFAKLHEEMQRIDANLAVLEKSGLKKSASARELLNKRNALSIDCKNLIDEDYEDRRMCARLLLQCFAMCDALTVATEMMRDQLIKVYGSTREAEDNFGTLLNQCAKNTGEVVEIIDKAHDFRMSMNYAKMADEVTEAVLLAAYEVVHRHYEADNGNNITHKGTYLKK